MHKSHKPLRILTLSLSRKTPWRKWRRKKDEDERERDSLWKRKASRKLDDGPPIGRVTSRLIATARGSVLYSVVVYYARRSGRGIREPPLSIQNSYTGSVYARVAGQAGQGSKREQQQEKKEKKEDRASTYYGYV